jgi:predicted aspartyl protease
VGTFTVEFEIGEAPGGRWERVEALVDAGASYTRVPSHLLERLGVERQFQRDFQIADGSIIQRDMKVTSSRWRGQVLPTLVVFGDEGSAALLGAHTLEGFGLSVDPVKRLPVPVPGLAMGLH